MDIEPDFIRLKVLPGASTQELLDLHSDSNNASEHNYVSKYPKGYSHEAEVRAFTPNVKSNPGSDLQNYDWLVIIREMQIARPQQPWAALTLTLANLN